MKNVNNAHPVVPTKTTIAQNVKIKMIYLIKVTVFQTVLKDIIKQVEILANHAMKHVQVV